MLTSNTNLRAPDVLARPDEWMAQAACHRPGVDPDVMHPEAKDEKGARAARDICRGCPVAVACLVRTMRLEGATKHMRFGIAGGTGIGHRQALYEQVRDGKTTLEAGAEQLVTRVLSKPTTLADVFAARTAARASGHVEWLLSKTAVTFQGRVYTPMQMAFLLGYGREYVGTVRAGCKVTGCVAWAHLTDDTIRRERKAESVQPASLPTPRERFAQYARPAGHGGHTRWTGPKDVKVGRNNRYTPRKLAFLVGHGREADGHVTTTCLWGDCVTPGHMADGPMRCATIAANKNRLSLSA